MFTHLFVRRLYSSVNCSEASVQGHVRSRFEKSEGRIPKNRSAFQKEEPINGKSQSMLLNLKRCMLIRAVEHTLVFLNSGGILLDVTGRNLSSVAKPIIQLTVVITRAAENSSTSNTTTRVIRSSVNSSLRAYFNVQLMTICAVVKCILQL